MKRPNYGLFVAASLLQEFEQMVDMAHDDAMRKLRREFSKMKVPDVRLLCYIFGGFSSQVISLFMQDSVANIYARKSRPKTRIKTSDSPKMEFFNCSDNGPPNDEKASKEASVSFLARFSGSAGR